MSSEPPVTEVEAELRRRRRWTLYPIALLVVLLLVVGFIATVVAASQLLRLARNTSPTLSDPAAHFAHGSIGAEPESGLPLWVWHALPRLFPKEFEGRLDYGAFGFLYPTNERGGQAELPYGIARRNYRGVELVWFNCAICHTGTWRKAESDKPNVVLGMPSNNLDLYRFIRFILNAGTDERLGTHSLMAAMRAGGARFSPIEEVVWRFYVIPQVREGLVMRYSRLHQFIADQAPWGPGRVDTFNPYKLVQMKMMYPGLAPEELHGASDFPAIFNQKPRGGMQLHWDGNNASLAERNLSAAIGAGVTPKTVDHQAIERVADWLGQLQPPPSPHAVDAAAAERGRNLYMAHCAACHGHQAEGRYVFEGAMLGKVDPNARLGADPGRLDSYTENFRQHQLSELFAGTQYRFRDFIKTNGYANMPLDGLWLRGPYLHNGSVPTLRALLSPPAERPVAYVRGLDVIDAANGGFVSPPCTPGTTPPRGFCYDTRLPGNGNGGHIYGTSLSQAEKADLLAYLLTF
jgi:mono/diheme cytochrome c family protein